MPERVVAIGDIHGDCRALARVLRLAGLMQDGHWSGGSDVLVQIGDVLDRGDEELKCMQLLALLKREASESGGRVITLLGNHEVLNAAGVDYYASPLSAGNFGPGGRTAAFRPGAKFAAELATWPVACVVGDTAFVHAGLTEDSARVLDEANAAAARWLLGQGPPSGLPPALLWPSSASSLRSPLWMRDLSSPPDVQPSSAACAELDRALSTLGVRRLVIGHTVQSRINGACRAADAADHGESTVWRIDVGLSSAMASGTPQALEIARGGRIRVLTGVKGDLRLDAQQEQDAWK